MKHLLLFLTLTLSLFASQALLSIGVKTTRYDYYEYDTDNTILDSEHSALTDIKGIYGTLTFPLEEEGDIVELFISQTTGITDYVGALLSGGSYGSYLSTTQNTFIEMQLNRVGTFASTDSYDLAYLIGAGYREWERTLSVAQNEIYYWPYWQLGLKVMPQQISREFSYGLDISYQKAYQPKIDLIIPSLIPDTTLDLGPTESVVYAFSLLSREDSGAILTLKIEYEITDIGRSNVKNGVLEPRSEQNNIHFSVGATLDLESLSVR